MDDVHAINLVYLDRHRKPTLNLEIPVDHAPPALFDDTPAPWRAVRSYTEISAVVDRNGHILFLCPKELAGRIVAAVNMVECGHGKEGQ